MQVSSCNIVRCNPTVTVAKLAKLKGSGRAVVSERCPNAPLEALAGSKWAEVKTYDELVAGAHAGKDVFYKTASYGGAARFYVSR